MKVREKFKMPPILKLGNVIDISCTARAGMHSDEAFVRVAFEEGTEPFVGYVPKSMIFEKDGRSFLRVMLFERPDAKTITIYIGGESTIRTVPLAWLVQQMVEGGVVCGSVENK